MLKFSRINSLLLVLLLVCTAAFAQTKSYEGPQDPAGDPAAEKLGYMEGNAVRCQFRNTTELSDWGTGTDPYATKWPNDFRGSKMNDGIGLLIGARIFIKDDGDTTTIDQQVVDDPAQIQAMLADSALHTLYYLQTSYREEMDTDPTGQVEWALYPPRGYANYDLPDAPPAMASKPSSWPDVWPSSGFETKWPGAWNGRFGKDVFRADEECYFVANDAQDQENLVEEAKVRYYPRPGYFIGDLDPQMSVQVGLPWGGIGIRVAQRGFQWNNAQARDAIFWEYSISNMTQYDLTEVGFGYWVDNAIGGNDGNDELAAFDTFLDLAYSWDVNGIGDYGLKVGTMGFAYLESPGNSTDGIDNDEDGLIDEKRDNIVLPGEEMIGPTEGITNLDNFLKYYQLKEEDLRPHFAADEDQDWDSFDDKNGNGVWDEGEDLNDDVGVDGSGPNELGYTGPDADGTEGNGRPDLKIGVGSEPDFGLVDVTESDMLGLTSFRLFPIPEHTPPYKYWFRNDESMWELVGQDSLVPYIGTVSNLAEVFATGVFPLYGGNTERISMSQLHSWDDGSKIKAGDPVENPPISLFNLKRIVQIIYETDYRFAMPPVMPTLTATEGDGFVLLTWDNDAEIKTRDPFMGNENDFEGYKLYKASDRNLTDAIQITDGHGKARERAPLFQCDLVNRRQGFVDYGLVDGMSFYLGEDSGIRHSYKDENVQNGRTYYYALVAYDYGIPDIGVRPTENNFELKVDKAENIIFTSKNVAVATPRQEAAGYNLDAEAEIIPTETVGHGSISAQLLAKKAAKDGAIYKVKFDVERVREVRWVDYGVHWATNGIRVFRKQDGTETMIYQENPENPGQMLVDSTESLGYWYLKPNGATSDLFDGINITINTPVMEAEYDYLNSGWIKGEAPIYITPSEEDAKYFPWDYEIVWTDSGYPLDMEISRTTRVEDENGVRITDNLLGQGVTLPFYVQNSSVIDSTTTEPLKMTLVVHDIDESGAFEMTQDKIYVGATDSRFGRWAGTVFAIDFTDATEDDLAALPSDAAYQVRFIRPFWESDSLMFKMNLNESTDVTDMKEKLKQVKVVPNPYVSTNALEPSLANKEFNQRRRIMFTHVPSKSTIRIFTPSGVFVDEINVQNDQDTGMAYWDLLTKDGLEVAAGMYIWHLTADDTGDEIMGKLAIIK